jgi:hypothetical protein
VISTSICDLVRMIRGPIYTWGLGSCVADPHHLDADTDPDPDLAYQFDEDPNQDPDPTFHFNADPDPSFQIKARDLEKVVKMEHIPLFWLVICKLMRIRM